MSFILSNTKLASGCHVFAHQAMATVFEIVISNQDEKYARQASQEAFRRLDSLEQSLSRFLPTSDISRINHARENEIIRLGPDAFACLKLCAHFYTETNGAFDITIGLLMSTWLNPDKTLRRPTDQEVMRAGEHTGMHHLIIDETAMMVQVLLTPLCVDLGALGKGYAVDQMAHILQEYSIENFLIHGGASSVLGYGRYGLESGWPLTLSRPWLERDVLEKIMLSDRSISGSGLQKGRHIINPRTARPVEGQIAAWAFAPDAASTDALSTAFMIMTGDEIQALCRKWNRVGALVLSTDQGVERLKRFGASSE